MGEGQRRRPGYVHSRAKHSDRLDSLPGCGSGGWLYASLAPAKERFYLRQIPRRVKPSSASPFASYRAQSAEPRSALSRVLCAQ
jgi:hypothetical protein